MENTSVQMDIATMALKGQRYNEAENMYMQIATQNNSSEAWTGMAICKLYQLAKGRTMDEVVFCINKAKSINPDLSNEIENHLIFNCQVLLNTYIKMFEESLAKQKELKTQAIIGGALAGVSLIAGLNSKSTFGTVASLAGSGAGVGVAVDAINNMNSVNEIQKFILNKCDEINNALQLNVNNSNPNYIEYNNNLQVIISNVQNATILQNTQQKWYENKTTVIILTILLGPVGLYGWYLRKKHRIS